jgi:hypothetical protein
LNVAHGEQIQPRENGVEPVENGCSVQPKSPAPGKHAKRNKNRAKKRKELARPKRLAEFQVENGIVSKESNVDCGPAGMLIQARELFALGFLPSSAVTARIALETFLRQLCEARGVRVVTSRSRLADVVDALCLDGYFDHRQRSMICQHIAVANGAAHGEGLLTWWECSSLLSFVAVTIATLGLSAGN